jgi:hypothetical protein
MKRLGKFLLVFLALWGALTLLSGWVRLIPDWSIWLIALLSATAVEAILFLYQYESGAVTQKRARWLISLRLIALGLLLWILLEPTWIRTIIKNQQREVIILLDDSASMHLTDDGQKSSRIAMAEQALAAGKIQEQLGETMRVRTIRAARSVKEGDKALPEGWADATDLAAALNQALEQVPPDELAGVLLLSDGRHNRPERVEDVARRFGILDAPIGMVAIGSSEAPRDASILSIEAPEAIHLGDRMRIAVKTKFDGYKGSKAKVLLKRGDTVIEEREIAIPQDHHREDLRFIHLPKEGGVGDYHVEIQPLERERFDDNNKWEFETSITDARTNVLLVDSSPRWEFRYLRNLFYGRDKSVHLQYLLMHPDRIASQQDQVVYASASRPFGDAQATRLPQNEAEWKKFDVIILGDLEAAAIDQATWEIISRCVNERAALLVIIAGPQSMPHSLTSDAARSLVPVEMDWGIRNYYTQTETNFSFSLTSEGSRHPVTQQSTGKTSNEKIWSEFPTISWRHPVSSVKEGAEILLTASNPTNTAQASSGGELNDALNALAQRRQREIDNALLVTRQTGKGKVALLLTDRTWRLREGAGDVFHHRFWGNLVRWGAGPSLRAGGSRVRMGTDQLTYTPDDSIKITARLRNTDLSPVDDATINAEILQDGKTITQVTMKVVENSNGLYEAELQPLTHSGRYEVRIGGKEVQSSLADDNLTDVTASVRVVGSRGPIELSETTRNMPLLETMASLSGGKVVEKEKITDLLPLFLGNKSEKEETREISLWDQWWVLVLLALVLSTEWIVRRAGGLP